MKQYQIKKQILEQKLENLKEDEFLSNELFKLEKQKLERQIKETKDKIIMYF